MSSLIAWALVGLIVGAVARFLMPGPQPMGLFMTMVLGILGSLLGGGIAWLIWGTPDEPFAAYAWPGYLLSIVGAVIILALTRRAGHRSVP